MRNLVKTTLFSVLSIGLMSTSCSRQPHPGPQNLCQDVACTAMFAMISVEVTDANGKPVVLDEYYTERVKTGEKIKPQQQLTSGTYVILDDSYQRALVNQADDFRFTGKKNGVTIVNETYRIAADCCHVNKINGNSTIVVK